MTRRPRRFAIERSYAAPAAGLRAFADPALKGAWFAARIRDRVELDFRVGGGELRGGTARRLAPVQGRYHAIVPDQRIVFAYDLLRDDRRSRSR